MYWHLRFVSTVLTNEIALKATRWCFGPASPLFRLLVPEMPREDAGDFLAGLQGTMHFGMGCSCRSLAGDYGMPGALDRHASAGRFVQRELRLDPDDGMQLNAVTQPHLAQGHQQRGLGLGQIDAGGKRF